MSKKRHVIMIRAGEGLPLVQASDDADATTDQMYAAYAALDVDTGIVVAKALYENEELILYRSRFPGGSNPGR